jgi:hypothetical protein
LSNSIIITISKKYYFYYNDFRKFGNPFLQPLKGAMMVENDEIPKWKLATAIAMESIGLIQGGLSWKQRVTELPVSEQYDEAKTNGRVWENEQDGVMRLDEKKQKDIEEAHDQAMEDADMLEFAQEKEKERREAELADQDDDYDNFDFNSELPLRNYTLNETENSVLDKVLEDDSEQLEFENPSDVSEENASAA